MLFFLTNPLETFKSFAYDFFWLETTTATNYPSLTTNLFGTDFFINQHSFFLFTLNVVICLGLLLIYFQMINIFKDVVLTFLTVVLLQILFYFFDLQTFIQNEVFVQGAWQEENQVYTLMDIEITNKFTSFQYGILSTIFIKEMFSFISLFILLWFLGNVSFRDTLLIPKTILEIVDETIYKKNLTLFVDALQLKHHKEIRNYQEFFIKVHGLLLFILVANVQGMIPFSSTITSSLLNTFYISFAVFINIIYTMLTEKGIHHFFGLFVPHGCPFLLIFLLSPIEFISYNFRVVSLSVRLFANMMAGHTLMKVFAGFSWSLLLLGDHYILIHYVPFFILFLLTFLELAVGFIQTYIFVALVYLYLTDIFIAH